MADKIEAQIAKLETAHHNLFREQCRQAQIALLVAIGELCDRLDKLIEVKKKLP